MIYSVARLSILIAGIALCLNASSLLAQTTPAPTTMTQTVPPVAVKKGAYFEKQPEMKAAIDALREAIKNLKKASGDKGGHRVKALKLTQDAIKQTRKGIEFDNKTLSAEEKKAMEDELKLIEAEAIAK
jgi:hypothetical protein